MQKSKIWKFQLFSWKILIFETKCELYMFSTFIWDEKHVWTSNFEIWLFFPFFVLFIARTDSSKKLILQNVIISRMIEIQSAIWRMKKEHTR